MMNDPRVDLLAEIDWAQKNGFEFLDLTLEPPSYNPTAIKLLETRKALNDANLGIVGHTAYYLPFASPYESLRKAAVQEMRWALEVFAKLGAPKMTVHPDRSIAFSLGSKGILEKNLQSFKEIGEFARPLGIQVLIENMDRTFNTVEQIQQAFSQIPQLGFHLDVGHANLNVAQNRTEEFLQAFHDRLVHVHLSDNFGKSEDLHLPLGAGNIEWRKIIPMIRRFGYDGTITLEIFSADRRYLLISRERLREIWES
ncbi:MAG: sugar phosphate isomerase/epimerase [Deltaproteobacteria bacterium]|nr:sugar phosphate isomerase/epimerase [Deltaproteobacteria bacterium]